MTERKLIALLIGLAWAVAVLALIAAEDGTRYGLAAAAALTLALGLLWWRLDRGLLKPLAQLGGDLAALVHSRKVDKALALPPGHRLEQLGEALTGMVEQLRGARQEMDAAQASATSRVAEQKSWLEVILLDLSEGVVVCNANHQILLYNQSAVRLLGRPETVGLGRPLFTLITREPVLHALELLEFRRKGGATGATGASVPFVCATVDSRAMLQGRMAQILGPDRLPTGYVVSFSDVSRELATMAKDNAIRRALTRDLRGPLANLRAAAETIASYPQMTARERAAFDEVILDEGTALSNQIEWLEGEFREASESRWLMADIHSLDLFNCLARSCGQQGALLTMVGIPLWLHGDSHSLLLAIERLVECLCERTGARAFDIEALLGDKHVYIDIAWRGEPVPSGVVDGWMSAALEGALGRQTVGDVLERHGAEPWSQALHNGIAVLRIPLPAPFRPQFTNDGVVVPARPEFYDFDLIRAHSDTGALGPRLLSDLTYVVFDTETTGLSPTEGDQIVSIGGVRVVNRRILTGETFERLVHPGRTIPPDSIRFHGITDEMVTDKPPIEVVLPQFRAFVGDAVLVAHNAAFDLKFLQMKEAATGIVLRNPVLDTLLLAALLDPEGDHSLDAVSRRLGIDVHRRHSALGDALVTAEVLVRLFDLLEARGIRTFDEVMRASNMTAEVRIRGLQF